MHNIDFLPIEYRQRHMRRQDQPWQVVVAVAFVVLLAAAAVVQHQRRRYVESELAAITPIHDAALAQQTRLAELQVKLRDTGASADLLTYLRHPWPRTQLLQALLEPLPEELTLQQVQIVRVPPGARAPSEATAIVDRKAEEDKLKAMTPAERDLTKMCGRLDPLQTTVILAGTATESAALHRYLDKLNGNDLFAKAELESFTSIEAAKTGAVMQFRAVLAVRPGYGQVGGPAASPKKSLAAVDEH